MGTMDPTFNPVITDDSAAFSQKAVQAMEKERSQMQLLFSQITFGNHQNGGTTAVLVP